MRNFWSILLIIGGINVGLVGIASLLGAGNWDVINLVLGSWSFVEAVVQVLIGVAAVMALMKHLR